MQRALDFTARIRLSSIKLPAPIAKKVCLSGSKIPCKSGRVQVSNAVKLTVLMPAGLQNMLAVIRTARAYTLPAREPAALRLLSAHRSRSVKNRVLLEVAANEMRRVIKRDPAVRGCLKVRCAMLNG